MDENRQDSGALGAGLEGLEVGTAKVDCPECGIPYVPPSGEPQGGKAATCPDCVRAAAPPPPRGPRRGGPRFFVSEDGERMPLSTGDANEYRSPMQGGASPLPGHGRSFGGGGGGGRGPARGPRRQGRGPAPASDGIYRAPAFGGPRPAAAVPARAAARAGGAAAGEGKRRRERKLFDVRCSACSKDAQVPFEPTAGREVFCQDCFKTKRA